jgi:hypothetical protein
MDSIDVDLATNMLVKSLSEIEELAEEIMTDKQQVFLATIKSISVDLYLNIPMENNDF